MKNCLPIGYSSVIFTKGPHVFGVIKYRQSWENIAVLLSANIFYAFEEKKKKIRKTVCLIRKINCTIY